jgi:hypothetical protein
VFVLAVLSGHWGLAGVEDVHFDHRHLIDPEHGVGMEVGWLHAAVVEGDLPIECWPFMLNEITGPPLSNFARTQGMQSGR